MKYFTIILSLLFLALSFMPCSDGYNDSDEHLGEISADHNHKNDSDDSCPITCICNCCGMTIAYQIIEKFHFKINIQIPTTLISTYQSNYLFDFHSNIWQPPQLIS